MVSEFNQFRAERNRLPLEVSVSKFGKGLWSVDISVPTDGTLYSWECSAIFPLLFQLGCTFFIGSYGGNCVIFIQ